MMKYGTAFFKQVFSRRVFFLSLCQGFFLSILGIRSWWLQIKNNEKYFNLAEGNRIDIRFLLPARGRILTDDLQPIADIIPKFEVVLIPYRVKALEPVLDKLATFTEITPEKRQEILDMNKHLYRYAYLPIKTLRDWDEAIALSGQLYQLPAIDIQVISERYYPDFKLYCHLTGYVGKVNTTEQAADPSGMLRIPHFKIGKQGLEKVHDQTLRGVAGESRVEVNHVGKVNHEIERIDALSGTDLHLTIHSALQKKAAEAMGDQAGSVVLVNIKNGAVLCMYSTPAFDPNLFTDGISFKDWNNIINDEQAPMNNKAIIGQYPAGSTFKMMTLMAALEAKVIDKDETIYCKGHYNIGNARFHCWKYTGHGHVNATQSLMHSCDVYFYEIAHRLGIDKIADMARRYGLGMPTGIQLPFEKSGLMPNEAWKMERYGKKWTAGETIISSIGQGSVLVTPIQLALMTARIASNQYVEPHLVRQKNMPIFKDIAGIHPDIAAIVRQGMYDVVNAVGGTAPTGKIDPAYGMAAGKTGTAQVRRITMAERKRGVLKNDQLPWKYRDHGLYVGFAPFDNPIFAVSCIAEHGGSGSKVAAPIATAVLQEALKIYGLNEMAPYV